MREVLIISIISTLQIKIQPPPQYLLIQTSDETEPILLIRVSTKDTEYLLITTALGSSLLTRSLPTPQVHLMRPLRSGSSLGNSSVVFDTEMDTTILDEASDTDWKSLCEQVCNFEVSLSTR